MNNRGNSYGRARAEAKDGAAAEMSYRRRGKLAAHWRARAAGNFSGREMVGERWRILREFLRACARARRRSRVNTTAGDCVRSGKLYAM